MARRTRGAAWRFLVSGITLFGLIAAPAGSGQAASSFRSRTVTGRSAERELISSAAANEAGDVEKSEVLEGAQQYAAIRTLPAGSVPAAAYLRARADAASLQVTGGAWSEITTQPYNSDDPNYRDPIFSNSGGGAGNSAGRIQALAVDGSTVYAGAADGGVWKSTDRGRTWAPVSDDLPSISSGSLAIDPANHSVWYGTGEASTAFENYLGTGVYRSADGGAHWKKVGGSELEGSLIGALAFDGNGHVLAATSRGVYRRSTSADLTAKWKLVLRPGTPGPYGFTFANDVAVQPGTGGKVVVANFGWRSGPADYAGFYVSTKGGQAGTWKKVHTKGDLRSNYIARASFAYAADGSRLYALVESWQYLASKPTGLYGVFMSPSGDIAGPWTKIAGAIKLQMGTGSAMELYGSSFRPGVQAWYNQSIGVDPSDPDHLYVGLEEMYETTDAGATWTTAGPYWNFTLKCYKKGGPDNCPNSTHPDQHAVAFGKGVVYVGNDGGVYRRSLDVHTSGSWNNLNATLHTLQYYNAGIGTGAAGDAYWGGLQDNGVSLLSPGATTMVEPFGGDGGDVIVDAANPDRAVVEYTDLDMALTTNGGRSDGTAPAFRDMSPSCYAFTYMPDPCDPNPRFIAPFEADPRDPNNHWVAGGEYVWDSTMGWNTTCSTTACDWKIVHDTGVDANGTPNTTTALAVDGAIIYAAWCGGGCNPGLFSSGIDTNYGGTWHTVASPAGNGGDPLPQRYVTALAIDPNVAGHVYAVFGGYSRRWIPSGGVGHVFESNDGGVTWTDISGNLPDVPGADLAIVNGHLILGTDAGVFVASTSDPTMWEQFGTGLPNAAVNDLVVSPDGSYVLAATHGRGLWSIPSP